MRQELLAYLQCYQCQQEFDLTIDQRDAHEAEVILEGTLTCRGCRLRFPVRAGIPRMMPADLDKDVVATSENFGTEWTVFNKPSAGQRQQLIDWLAPLRGEDFKDKTVVELGCGMGRNILYFGEHGARAVIGMDLSQAVDQAYKNCRAHRNIHIIQADIYHAPLKPLFDFPFSLGVLHHLPNPREGFHHLVRLARPGGMIYAWIYGRENNGWVVHVVNPIRTLFTSKLSPRALRLISMPLTAFLMVVLHVIYRPLNRLAPGLAQHLFYNAYLYYISAFTFREIELIVYDHLTAPTAFYIPREDFARWFSEEGLTSAQILWHNRNSWKGIATKPA